MCRGNYLTPDPYAPGPADVAAITKAVQLYGSYTTNRVAASSACRLLPVQQRLGAASAVTAIQKVQAMAAAVPSGPPPVGQLRRPILPAVLQAVTICETAAAAAATAGAKCPPAMDTP